MTIVWAVSMCTLAIVLFGFAYGQSRRPDPWSLFDKEAVASAFAIVIATLLVAGSVSVGVDVKSALKEARSLPSMEQIGLVAAPLIAIVLAVLLARPAFRAPTSGGVVLPMPPRGPAASPDPRPASGGRQRMKKAA